MAEEATCQKVELKARRLFNMVNTVRQALTQATDTAPTKSFLDRQLATIKKAWNEYKTEIPKLMGVARPGSQQALQ